MGNPNHTDLFVLGEFQVSPDGLTATIPCFLPEEKNISVIVQDESGRAWIEKDFSLKSGKHELQFNISKLRAGIYNGWFDAFGETYIRSFRIEKPSGSNTGLLGRIKKLFS
ncbi:MAG TPA: hypothetical protein ENJ20_03020 [Bacteroidetes bacterium]|nr:hypothetical protein [Bacteroidota bacterium]